MELLVSGMMNLHLYSLNRLCSKLSILRYLRGKVCQLEKITPKLFLALLTNMSCVLHRPTLPYKTVDNFLNLLSLGRCTDIFVWYLANWKDPLSTCVTDMVAQRPPEIEVVLDNHKEPFSLPVNASTPHSWIPINFITQRMPIAMKASTRRSIS